jgi:hypothetical protein
MKPNKAFFSGLLIFLLVFTIYMNVLPGQFIWDDDHLVKNNPLIKSWAYLPALFTKDIGAGAGLKYYAYRPFQMMSYMADHSLWKLDPGGYHLTNVVLHALVALAVFWLWTILSGNALLSLLAALLFAVHPIHTEAVDYISGRSDLLGTLFLLSAFIFYVKANEVEKPVYYFLIPFTFALGLLSRESTMILPGLLLFYHFIFKKRFKVRPALCILSVALLYLFLRSVVLKGSLPPIEAVKTTVFQRAPGFFFALATYLKLLFLPFPLHMEYGNKLHVFSEPGVLAGVLFLAGALFFAVQRRKSAPLVTFSVGWFFISLLPLSNLYPVNAFMAEHWLYLPSIGFFLILASGFERFWDAGKTGILVRYAMIFLMAFYGGLTFQQNRYWLEPFTFFQRTLEYAPDSGRVYYDMGLAYEAKGKVEDAIVSYQKTIQYTPQDAKAYNNLAILYFQAGKRGPALALFRKAIEVDPGYKEARYNLALAVHKIAESQRGRL